MGSFTKIYSRSFHPEESVTLTWDAGYRNVEIYDGKRIVNRWDLPGVFTKGTSFQDEKLGKIQIEFTSTRPLQLQLKIDGKKYTPNKAGKPSVDLSGAIGVFWGMTALTAVVYIYVVTILANSIFLSRVSNFFLIGAGVIGIYLFSAIMMSLKKHWAFFIGFAYMTLSTIWYTSNILENNSGFSLLIIFLFIRFILIVYLAICIRKVLFAMRLEPDRSLEGVIDNEI